METTPGRLGDYVLSRRRGLGMTRDAVRAAGGPSDTRLASIEEGTGPAPTPSTLRKLDTALQWTPGSAATVQRGGTPTELVSSSEPATFTGVSQVAVAADELANLIGATDRLEAEMRSQHRTAEVDGALANLRVAVSALAGRWATDLLERNAGAAGYVSPVIELAMGHLLDAPVDGTPEPERTERQYRRWLAQRDVTLTGEQREQFEKRLARRRVS
ncbi:MAG: helix-turn-helix domain-containing protein [Rhodococcus sp.]|nr:helix-turn-helix domain-containing protein [Rhodococcus sp. (in: high G+C Gram-positive bacteria)]